MNWFFKPTEIPRELHDALTKDVCSVWEDPSLYRVGGPVPIERAVPGRVYEIVNKIIGSKKVIYLHKWDGRFLYDGMGTIYEAAIHEMREVFQKSIS